MKKITLSTAFVLCLFVSGFAQQNEEYKNAVKKMFEVSGTEETFKAAIAQMFVALKSTTQAPAEVLGELETEFLNTSMNDLTDMLLPVYERHLSLSDLKAIITFYETPAGKNFALKNPLIVQESMQVGQEWGMKVGEAFARKLKERGY